MQIISFKRAGFAFNHILLFLIFNLKESLPFWLFNLVSAQTALNYSLQALFFDVFF